jgi:NAD(P)-dependent dehydrogenase (short-subunit alcohol dehydrogenase family)
MAVEAGAPSPIVTGASRGIGAVAAKLLADSSLRVAVDYRSSAAQADDVVLVADLWPAGFVVAGRRFLM